MRSIVLQNRLVYAIACIPLLRFLYDWSKGVDFLIYQYLVDDAFLYFQISKHIPEFNIGIPNSGFHALYAFLISPLHSLLYFNLAIPLSLLILVISNCLSVILVFQILSTYWERPIPIFCAFMWSVSGKMYSISLMGMETVLAVFIVLIFLKQFVKIQKCNPYEIRPRDFLILGFLAGFGFLARMDSPLILAPFFLYLGFNLLKHKLYKNLLSLFVPCTILPLSWLVYIKIQTGHFAPTSSTALRVLRGIDNMLIVRPRQNLDLIKQITSDFLSFFIGVHESEFIKVAAIVVSLVVVIMGIFFLLRDNGAHRSDDIVNFSTLVLFGTLCWGSYYVFHLGRFRPWYFAYLSVGAYAIFLPLIFTVIFRIIRNPKSILIVGLISIFIFGILSRPTNPFSPQEYDKYKSALATNVIFNELPPPSYINVGSFNAGAFNYFMDKDVINLDGVVNPEAIEALKNNDLPGYIRKKNIGYLIEHEDGANLHRIYEDERFELTKWIDLTEYYDGYKGRYTRKTYLWKIKVKDE